MLAIFLVSQTLLGLKFGLRSAPVDGTFAQISTTQPAGILAQLSPAKPVPAPNSGPSSSESAPADSDRKGAILAALNLRMGNQQNLWFKNGRFPTIVQSLRLQYDFNPYDNEIATNLGWMLENIHMYPEALDVYRKYRIDNSAIDPDSSFPEGFYYYRMKQYDDEIRLFEAAINSTPHPGPNIYRTLAHTYERLNRLDDSLRVYNAYLAWSPKDLAAIANVKRIKAKMASSNAKK